MTLQANLATISFWVATLFLSSVHNAFFFPSIKKSEFCADLSICICLEVLNFKFKKMNS